MSLKIVAISDPHGQQAALKLPKGDVLACSGDWSCRGTPEETEKFLDWLSTVRSNYKKVLCVPGNHDIAVEQEQQYWKERFKAEDVELLIDEAFYFNATVFYGMPWTPVFSDWGFMARPEKRKMAAENIPDETNVLISHGPPHMILDTLADNGSEPGAHAGCTFLAKRVERLQPFAHIFGHIHEGGGITMQHNTLFVNASCMDEYYRLVNGFKVIYI